MHHRSNSIRSAAVTGVITPALLGLCLFAGAPAMADNPWGNVVQQNGVEYLPLDTIRSFYKFAPMPVDRSSNRMAISNGGFPIVFTPGSTHVNIGGYECRLVHPATKHANGDLLISRTDAVKLFDPILRPTYITPRRVIRTIILDPGHGGGDSGSTANQLRESDLTLQIAETLRRILTERGYKVVLTRERDVSVSARTRVEKPAQADAPVFISLHANSGRNDISGIETYCMQPAGPGQQTVTGNACDAENIALAFSLHASLISATGAEDGACRRARYSLLSSVPCPSALVQVGYLTNAEEAAKLNTPEYRDKIALAIADGITTFAKAVNPSAAIPSSTAPVDTTPPATYESEAITPHPPQQSTPSSNKGKKSGKSTPAKGKNTKGKK